MTEWKTYKLGDICKRVCSGGTPKSTESSYYDGDIPWLNTKEINFNRIYSTERCITQKGLDNSSAKWIDANCVIVAMYGATAAKVAINKIPLTTNQACCNLSIDEKIADYRFVYYWLCFNYTNLASLANGGAQQNLNAQQIKDFEISLPSLEEQRRIAGILGAIDDKIENNRHINTNLELQAQALYKQWFVDNRKDDWEEKPLSEIVFFQEGPGIRNWQYVEKKGVRFINIRCINDGDVNVQNANMISEDEACGKYAHFLLEPLDIVMSCSGTLGRYAIIRQEHLPLCLNTSVIRFRPAQCIEDYSFVYGYLSSAEFLNKQEEMACGSVQANFGPTHLKQIKIKVPPKDYRMKYNNVVMPIINTMLKNRSEINMLSSLRDTLLPKLMNREIKTE